MSWEDIMRRVLPPIGGVSPQVTGPGVYGAGVEQGRRPPSSIPHHGVDFNYIGGRYAKLNNIHAALRSPVDGIVENAGQGSFGRIGIRDKNGFLHEILHTDARHVAIGDPVAAGQLIGTMGNTGTKDPHVHYQLKDPAGNVINPTEFWDRQGPADPNPSPAAYLEGYKQYLRQSGVAARHEFGRAEEASQSPSDPSNTFDKRLGDWISSPAGSAPRVSNQTAPSQQTVGIFSGKPMPNYPVPPPNWGLPDETRVPEADDENWYTRWRWLIGPE
jgi:hypothetical protein